MEKMEIEWGEYHQRCLQLAELVKENHENTNNIILIALSRGGLNPAIAVSNLLNMTFLSMGVRSYDKFDEQKSFELYQVPAPVDFKRNQDIVIIDDLVDSGHTLKFVYKYLKDRGYVQNKIYTYVLYDKGISVIGTPEFKYVQKIDPNKWVVFPYEKM